MTTQAIYILVFSIVFGLAISFKWADEYKEKRKKKKDLILDPRNPNDRKKLVKELSEEINTILFVSRMESHFIIEINEIVEELKGMAIAEIELNKGIDKLKGE